MADLEASANSESDPMVLASAAAAGTGGIRVPEWVVGSVNEVVGAYAKLLCSMNIFLGGSREHLRDMEVSSGNGEDGFTAANTAVIPHPPHPLCWETRVNPYAQGIRARTPTSAGQSQVD